MEDLGKIGRAKVREVRREGAFILRILDPEISSAPIEPGSEAAEQIVAEISKQKGNYQRPAIRRGKYTGHQDNK